MIACTDCSAPVCLLEAVKQTSEKGNGTPLVVQLTDLAAAVQQTRPHPDSAEKRFKRGKLGCACGANLGNIQNNIRVPPFKSSDVGLLKLANVSFRLASHPQHVFCTKAAQLAQAVSSVARGEVSHREAELEEHAS